MLGQGREAARLYLQENKKVAKQIEDEITKKVKSGATTEKVVMGSEEKEKEEE